MNNGDGLRSTERLLCSAELPFQLNHHFTCLSVSSIVLSITSFMGNNLMLVAFHTESPLHAPPKNFIAFDLGIGLVTGPLYSAYLNSALAKRWNVCRFAFASGFRYKQVVTLKHAYIAVGVIWIVSIFSTAVSFLKYFITLIIAYTVISLYLVISAYCCINIYLTLREHRSQAHCIRVLQQSPAVPLNIAT
ncbi:unnamed protein product, partial [Pocillopora meandrina]